MSFEASTQISSDALARRPAKQWKHYHVSNAGCHSSVAACLYLHLFARSIIYGRVQDMTTDMGYINVLKIGLGMKSLAFFLGEMADKLAAGHLYLAGRTTSDKG